MTSETDSRTDEVVDLTTDSGALMRTVFDAVGRKDLDALAAHWDERSVDHFHALDLVVQGPDDLRAFFDELFTAVEDMTFTVEAVHAGDGVATGRWRVTGVFSGGPFQGILPTGRPLDLHGVDVMQFNGDMVGRNDVYYDGLAFARQVGLLPAADTTADRAILSAFNAVTKLRRKVAERSDEHSSTT